MLTHEPLADDGNEKIRVVILEDGRYDRLGMITELSADPAIDLVDATAQPHELLAAIGEHVPQVAVVDLRIYDDDAAGLNVIREVKRAESPVKVIVLTAFPVLSNFLTAFDLGVEAFVMKAAIEPRPTLTELVRFVAAGGRYYDPDMVSKMRRLLEGMHPRQEDDPHTPPTAHPKLTHRELEVLHLLAAGRTVRQIADELIISIHTAKTHIGNAKAKLGAKDRREAVLIAGSADLLNPLTRQK